MVYISSNKAKYPSKGLCSPQAHRDLSPRYKIPKAVVAVVRPVGSDGVVRTPAQGAEIPKMTKNSTPDQSISQATTERVEYAPCVDPKRCGCSHPLPRE